MPDRALRRLVPGDRAEHLLPRLNASNARQGIKTNEKHGIVGHEVRLNASNARQGIKTPMTSHTVFRPAYTSERLQCPTGH